MGDTQWEPLWRRVMPVRITKKHINHSYIQQCIFKMSVHILTSHPNLACFQVACLFSPFVVKRLTQKGTTTVQRAKN